MPGRPRGVGPNMMPFFAALLLSPQGPKPITSYPEAHALDFWVGNWVVRSNGNVDGHDKVEKVLDGAAIIENWKDVGGNEGKSLFYFMPATKRWKQVWVTPLGQYKEKYSELFKNGIRFTGKVFVADGRSFGDRTTLTRMKDGKVRQVIELCRDGKTWKTRYDAVYSKE